jgi:hypothetical protein
MYANSASLTEHAGRSCTHLRGAGAASPPPGPPRLTRPLRRRAAMVARGSLSASAGQHAPQSTEYVRASLGGVCIVQLWSTTKERQATGANGRERAGSASPGRRVRGAKGNRHRPRHDSESNAAPRLAARLHTDEARAGTLLRDHGVACSEWCAAGGAGHGEWRQRPDCTVLEACAHAAVYAAPRHFGAGSLPGSHIAACGLPVGVCKKAYQHVWRCEAHHRDGYTTAKPRTDALRPHPRPPVHAVKN